MNCQEVMELMQRQLDGDLDESEYSVLMNHTRHCPDCAAMYDRLQMLSADLTSLPKVVPSYSLVDAILPELRRLELDGRGGSETEQDVDANETVRELIPVRRAARSRRFPSLRVMGGLIAAAVVSGLFIISYNAGIGPSFDSADSGKSLSANEAVTDMMVEQEADVRLKANLEPKAHQAAPDAGADTESKNGSDGGGQPTIGSQDQSGNSSDGNRVDPDMATGAGEVGKAEEPASDPETETTDATDNGSSSGFGGTEAPSEGSLPSTPGYQGIMSDVPATIAVVSPNGEMQAIAEGFQVKIYNVADQSLLVETDRKNGKLAQLVWSDDNTVLNYEVQLEQGAIEKYVIDVKAGIDTKA
ncbi:anti-sigma factor [Paenibacillus harenae]|uniref:anti-sigma factor n=1 Tax=Paenibacillus harenae TaxID=306543 RepID=UPI0027906B9C|nr:zf-HC2 domain-containing protein [Paenibacillus harenae]MDQ0058401.1 anti-sigma factor RsiW [Paenibacillus harenae]